VWPTIPLGQLAKPKQWPTLSKVEMMESGFPVYGANGRIGYHDTFTHEKPTILIGCRGSCGTVHVTEPKSYANGNAMALDELDETRADLGFLVQFFRQRGFRDVTSGTSQPQIIRQNIVRVEVPLPPLAEQRRIAEVLDLAEALRTKRRAALVQLDSLTQSLFLELFGDPATNPKGWLHKTLFDLGKVVTGGTPPSAKADMFDGPIPFVTPGDLESDEPVKRSLTPAGADESRTARAGATLVCCIGATIGKMGIARVRSAFNQQLNAVEWSDEIDDLYGYAVLRFFKPTIKTWGASTTLPILKKSSFEKIEIPVPPLSLQKVFTQRFEAAEKLRGVQKDSLAEMNALFASLQYRAFRGEL
jgi:type I restriction enzyme S subunit